MENICLFRVACGERLGGETFLDSLDSSGWLKHIKCVLDTSYFIAKVYKHSMHYLNISAWGGVTRKPATVKALLNK